MPFVALLVPFFVFAAAVVIIALSQTSAHTSTHAPGFSGFLETALHNNILTQLAHGISNLTRRMLSKFAASHLKMVTAYLHGLASLLRQEQSAMRANAHASARVATELDRAIPREAHKAAAPALARAKVADRHATHALSVGRTTSREFHRFRTDTRARLKADAHAIDVTIPHDIAGIRRREEALSRDAAKLRERTTSLENGAVKAFEWIRAHPLALATGVFAGAVAVALGRLGLGGLRCRNFRGLLSKFGCGLGTLLNDLLGIAIAGLVLESVCEFLPFLERAFGAVAGPITHLLTEVPLGDCEVVPDSWARLDVRHGPLPPTQTLGTFPS